MKTGVLMILDEVQCGMGRTGRLFAHEWAGRHARHHDGRQGDCGGGFPLGALLATERAASGMGAGTHGSTYGGNPLGCAVGAAVMQIVRRPGLPGRGETQGSAAASGAGGAGRQPPRPFRRCARPGA